jgi:hypothetical protein
MSRFLPEDYASETMEFGRKPPHGEGRASAGRIVSGRRNGVGGAPASALQPSNHLRGIWALLVAAI